MIIKLDTSVFKLAKQRFVAEQKITQPLTKAQWIYADRIVIAVLFFATVMGAIFF